MFDEAVLGHILDMHAEGISIVERTCSRSFRKLILKPQAVQQGERVHKRVLLPEYQLMFEMVNKVLLSRAERRSITSIEALGGYTSINLPGILIEHMKKLADFKDGNHGLPYGFLLIYVFEHFKVPLGRATVGTHKQMLSMNTLEECECIYKKAGVGSNSTISQLIDA